MASPQLQTLCSANSISHAEMSFHPFLAEDGDDSPQLIPALFRFCTRHIPVIQGTGVIRSIIGHIYPFPNEPQQNTIKTSATPRREGLNRESGAIDSVVREWKRVFRTSRNSGCPRPRNRRGNSTANGSTLCRTRE